MLRWFLIVIWGVMWIGASACSPNGGDGNKEQQNTEQQNTDTGSEGEKTPGVEASTDHAYDAGGMTEQNHHTEMGTGDSHDAGGFTEKPAPTDEHAATDHGIQDVSHDAGSSVVCKHDCDCIKTGWVCEGGECKPLRRMSLCVTCDGDCNTGDPCLQHDGNIGVCSTPPPSCTNDCDCKPSEGVCHEGKCNPTLKRAYMCPSCEDTTHCPAGKPCRDQSGSLGSCPTLCKHDCDCFGTGLLCDGTKCIPLRRMSFCLSCDGGTCKPGDPCIKKDQSIGVCPQQTFSCGAKTCKLGQEYCSITVGGARPTCEVLPPVTGNCPTGCHDAGLQCTDGQTRCTCPSTQCNSLPTGCTNCACLTSGGGVPPSACQCSEQNGAIEVKCFAP